jgi:hypothetical protein
LQHEPPCGGKVSDEWIYFVLDVEFEAFGYKHCGASSWLGASISEPHGRLFAQENAANSSVGLARNPEPVFVPADEKQWNCLTEDRWVRSLRQFRWFRGLSHRRYVRAITASPASSGGAFCLRGRMAREL